MESNVRSFIENDGNGLELNFYDRFYIRKMQFSIQQKISIKNLKDFLFNGKWFDAVFPFLSQFVICCVKEK